MEDGSPLGESAAQLIKLFGHSWEWVQTFGPVLGLSAQESESLVYLDSGNDSHWCGVFDEVDSFIIALSCSFFLEDDSWNIFVDPWGGKEHVSVLSSVFGRVLQINGLEFLDDWARWLVSSENTLSRCADLVGCFNQFFWEVFSFHVRI